jgi:hypothetical protein
MEWLGNKVDQYDAMVLFLLMPIFRIQAKNPFISCMVILVQFFSRVGTLPTLLLITCCTDLLDSVSMRVMDQVCEEEMEVNSRRRIRRRHMHRSSSWNWKGRGRSCSGDRIYP